MRRRRQNQPWRTWPNPFRARSRPKSSSCPVSRWTFRLNQIRPLRSKWSPSLFQGRSLTTLNAAAVRNATCRWRWASTGVSVVETSRPRRHWRIEREKRQENRLEPGTAREGEERNGMIKHKNGKFRLYTSDGSRPLGPWTTHASAVKQEMAIQAAKHARGK